MNVFTTMEIIQHYKDSEPEPFGRLEFLSNDIPNAGDTIMLYWLDGSAAYQAKVLSREGDTLHVTAELSNEMPSLLQKVREILVVKT